MAVEPNEIVIPLAAEELVVTARNRSTTVRVATMTDERTEIVDLHLRHEYVDIERVTIGKQVEAVPDIRQEGDVTIIPVVEEEVVIQRRLVLKEEIRVRRVVRQEHRSEPVVLRSQHVDIRRSPADEQSDDTGSAAQ